MIKTHRSRNIFKPPQLQHNVPLEVSLCENPEQNATFNLLRISSQDFDFNSIEFQQLPQKVYPKTGARQLQTPSTARSRQTTKKRLSVMDNYTESFKMNLRQCIHEAVSQQLIPTFKRHAVNLSNFLIFSDDNYNNLKICDGEAPQESQNDKRNSKSKQNKNCYSFMRKRNKSLMRQYLDMQRANEANEPNSSLAPSRKAPGHTNTGCRVSKSCEFEKAAGEAEIPMKIVSPSRIQQSHCIQFQCTSPTFRDKRINYRNFRYTKTKDLAKVSQK